MSYHGTITYSFNHGWRWAFGRGLLGVAVMRDGFGSHDQALADLQGRWPTLIGQGAAEASAQVLLDEGWVQTSRKYRTVARLPPGKTGYEALKAVDPGIARHFWEQFQRTCADHAMRSCYEQRTAGLSLELDEATFAAFRRLGGRPI